jgi:Peptidase family S51
MSATFHPTDRSSRCLYNISHVSLLKQHEKVFYFCGLNKKAPSFQNSTMSLNRILAFSSSRAGNSAYLETAAPVIKDFLGEGALNIAFIPFASVGNDYEDYVAW